MFKRLLKAKASQENSNEVLVMCRKCYSFKYDNSWHFEKPDYLGEKDPNEEISIQFGQCPACVEEALAMYDMEYV